MKNKTAVDMTHGPLLGKILLFSLPLMASNVLQILFNTADVVIVGRFAGYTSLAAVGSTTAIVSLFVNSFVMLSVGVNVVIARYLGLSGQDKEVSESLHTAMTIAFAGGVLMGLLGIAASDWLLDMIDTPADIRPLALTYLRLYFLGTVFSLVYNFGAAALRATGDTRRPMIFLTISGVINVALNLFFVIALKMNVAGVALATVISQCISAALILISLMRRTDAIRFCWSRLRVDKPKLREMAYIGIPAWIQGCLFSLSNIVIQSAVNAYSSVTIAGFSAASSIESFLYLTMNAFHQACQTFTSQNYGARKFDRIKRVVRICLLCTLVLGIAQSTLAVFFAPQLIHIYNGDAAVIEAGVYRLRMIASLYTIYGIADIFVGAIRGCGVSISPMIINLLGTCVFRLVWIWMLDTSAVGVGWVYMSYPISWLLILAALLPCWIHVRRSVKKSLAACGAPEMEV